MHGGDRQIQGGTLDDGFTTPQPQIWNEEGNEPGAGTVNYGTQGVVLTLQPGSAARGIASGCSVLGDFDVEVGITLINWPANNLYVEFGLGANDLVVRGLSARSVYIVRVEVSLIQ